MYADNTLTPKEATRLCALGTLAQEPVHYGALAGTIRHFLSRVAGPSLDLMMTSIELLKFEGLVEAIDGTGMEDDAVLAITPAGRAALKTLLQAPVRASSNDLNLLITALKFRFLSELELEDRRDQIEIMIEACESEIDRLLDLRAFHAEEGGAFVSWADHLISELESRLAWYREFKSNLGT